jgi:DNA-binding NtrC family response regulator
MSHQYHRCNGQGRQVNVQYTAVYRGGALRRTILDLMMPYINGDEHLCEISTHFPHIPVIMHTAVNEVNTAVGCMKRGAYDYLTKPVDKARLVTCVKKAPLKYQSLEFLV